MYSDANVLRTLTVVLSITTALCTSGSAKELDTRRSSVIIWVGFSKITGTLYKGEKNSVWIILSATSHFSRDSLSHSLRHSLSHSLGQGLSHSLSYSLSYMKASLESSGITCVEPGKVVHIHDHSA